jgi:FSR family fosmidomycin resistance protein-like MFS transporter
MKQLSLPALTGLAHGVSDAVAGFLVVQVLMLNSLPTVDYILIYNALAFGLQPVAGLLVDISNVPRRAAAVGLLLSAISLTLTWSSLAWGILLAGVGSAIFHAGGGATALTSTPGRAAGPGIFAAFGVIGLAFGSQLAFYFSVITIMAFVLVLIILAAALWFFPIAPAISTKPEPIISGMNIELLAFGLVLAVALRSFVWTGIQSGEAGYSQLALSIALAAGLGKLTGGFLADQFGWSTYAISAMVLSAILLAFHSHALWPLLAGIFFLQSVTPLSLAAMGRLMPASPALAASLVLGVGVLLGGLLFAFVSFDWLAIPLVTIPVLCVSAGLYWFSLRRI